MDAGTVLGGVSLAIQLSSSCLKSYEVITSTLEASEESRCLSVQFQIEQSRLRDFIQAAGLANGAGDDGVDRTFLNNKTVLLNILSQIEIALAQYVRHEGDHEGVPNAYTNPNSSSDLSQAYGLLLRRLPLPTRNVPESLGVVPSFTWSVHRKSESEKVLQTLGIFNNFLHELLDAQQLRSLQDHQQQNNMELVQTRNSLDDIRKLMEAAHASRNVHSRSNRWQHVIDAELENLAAFKTLYTSLLTNNTFQPRQIIIESSRIHFYTQATGHQDHPRAIYRPDANAEKEVWINWQDKHIPNDDDPTSTSMSPMEELTILLMAPKPDEFCIPTCAGYSVLQQDPEALPRPALVFENPTGIDPQAQPPVSLLHAIEQYRRPSLTHRAALAHKIAQCLLYLHAVNWLHKALRSSNILFFPSPPPSPDATKILDVRSPYMTGFDHSRRSAFNEATSDVPRVGRMEVYRHPDTQLDGPTLPYRKTFDIYSLGLILAEIALWKPLVSIMGIEATVDRSPRATTTVQERWLTSEPNLLISLRAEVGDKYAGAVETCLKGRDAFGIDRRDAETSATTAMTIQREFNAKVVRSLAEIVI